MGIFDSLFGKKEKNILFNNESLKNAVEEWQENSSKAEKKYGHISNWNVSNVTDMYSLFSYDEYSDNEHQPFNEDISNWDVSNVKNMSHLFFCNESFNQDISKWNVSKVKNMWRTFNWAKSFNQDISNWDVSSVTEMQEMFDTAESFNQDISKWNVSKVRNMERMFTGAKSFNQDLSKWNLKGMDGDLENIVEYLNSYSSNKIIVGTKTKKHHKERANRIIKLKIDDIKIKTTIGKFENAMNGEKSYVVSDYDDDYNLYFNSSAEEVYDFLIDITDEKLVITAEYYSNDNQLGEIRLEQVMYLNCECPEKLKKYYDGELFIHYESELLEIKSDDYKKINFDEIWEGAEITNSGVICETFENYITNI